MPNSRHNCGETCAFAKLPAAGDEFVLTAEHHLVEEHIGVDQFGASASRPKQFEQAVRERCQDIEDLDERFEAAKKCAAAFVAGECIFAKQEGVNQ
jgi:hypothetical protein